MDSAQFGQFFQIDLPTFIQKSQYLKCKVIGTITSITKHQKYIIQILYNTKEVIRCYKRFTQFQTLYQEINKQFNGYGIGEFPSRYQLFGKNQTRKYYFQHLINQIIKDYTKQHPKVKQQMMILIYNFLTLHILKQKRRKQKLQKKLNDKKNRLNLGKQMQTDAKSEDGKKVIKQKIQQNVQQQNYNTKQSKQHQRCPSVDLNKPSFLITSTRSHSMYDQVRQPITSITPTDILKTTLTLTQTKIKTVYNNKFQIKFHNQDQWKIGYIDIQDSNLLVFKNKKDAHFKTCIQLYRIQVDYVKRDKNIFDYFCDQTQLQLKRTFKQDQNVLRIYHQYDKNKILIRKGQKYTLQGQQQNRFSLSRLRDQIILASHIPPIYTNFEGVYYPIGKIFIFIHKLSCNWRKYSEKVWIRIRTGAMIYFTMPTTCIGDAEINQGFLIPISNAFQIIKLQCYVAKKKKDKGILIGSFKFNMVEFFTKPERSFIQKLQVDLNSLYSQKSSHHQTRLQLSLQNLSDFSSVYSSSFANQRDGIPPKAISSLQSLDNLYLSLIRIKCIIGHINLITRAFKRNVLKFKYPNLAYIFWTFILINASFVDITYILREFVAFTLLCIVYQQEHVYLIANYFMNKYIFNKIHPHFKKPQILSSGQIDDLVWSHQLRYIAEDYQYRDGQYLKKAQKKRDLYKFIVHERQFIIKQDEESFLQQLKEVKNILQMIYKMIDNIAYTLEKIANLLSWIDRRKTIFVVMILLILTGLASGITVRILVCILCIGKLVTGMSYYRSHLYRNNRKFAVYSLRYILQKSFPTIISNKNIHKNMNLIQLNQYLSNISFPINNQSQAKKLKHQLNHIIGIYLSAQSLYPKQLNQNSLKLVHLIDMIETCEQRLSLNFIAGQEGISDQFQQLYLQTRQMSDFDQWIIAAVSNFVFNIPSKLFLIFHKKQLDKIQKAEKEQIKSKQSESGIIKELKELKKFQDPNLKPQPIPGIQNKQNQPKLIDFKVLEAQLTKEKMLKVKQVSQTCI